MTTTALPTEQPVLTQDDHLHGTLPPAAIRAVVPHGLIPAEEPFEAWEDGAYVLAYLRHAGLR